MRQNIYFQYILKALSLITKPIIAIFTCLIHISCLSKPAFDEKVWEKQVNSIDTTKFYAAHYQNGRYFNPWIGLSDKSFSTLLRWWLSKKEKYSQEEIDFRADFVKETYQQIIKAGEKDFICWLGHSTLLIRVNGQYILTDPILFDRFFLPSRQSPSVIDIKDLNNLTDSLNIILTHNHFDHFDAKTLGQLNKNSQIFAPLGLEDDLKDLEFTKIKELDWWQETEISDSVKLISLPAQHWSKRSPKDDNKSLWCSYLLVTPKYKIYFGGDSGYFLGYKEFGIKFPNIDYALISVGASEPRWFMHQQHNNTEEALKIASDLKAKYFIPIHWGTYKLGDEPVGYPIVKLKELTTDKNRELIKIPILGKVMILE